MKKNNSYWLSDWKRETLGILMPMFIPVFIVFLFQDYFNTHTEVSAIWWLVLVLIIDVGHVYSTLFRFYWEKDTFQKHKTLLAIIPITAFIVGSSIHFVDSFLFWRILAYTALYHFIRQQYGFLRLYSRKQQQEKWSMLIDAVCIYSATLYPVIYWHIHLTGSLSWFVENDFIQIPWSQSEPFLFIFYTGTLVIFLVKEIYYSIKLSIVNIPKNAIVLGTYLSWYAGIVYFHGDLAFTLLNVVAHGIPYITLIWLYGERKSSATYSFKLNGAVLFSAIVIGLAYFEESLWDIFIWKDHPNIFPFLLSVDPLSNSVVLSIIVPLLTLPQITHYILDGFIWRFSKDKTAVT
jgi:hypothetical protein